MSRGEKGKSADVDDAQPLGAKHARGAVHDGHRVLGDAHLARGGRVPGLDQALANMVDDLGVGSHVGAGKVFLSDGEPLVGQDLPHLTEPPGGLHGQLHVSGVSEPVWVDERGGRHVGTLDRDVAARQRGDDSRVEFGIIVPIIGIAGLVLPEAVITACGKVFHFRPIGGEIPVQSAPGGKAERRERYGSGSFSQP